MQSRSILLAILLLVTCAGFPAYSQTIFSSLTGTVTDQSGAVVPNAQITATNRDTGTVRHATTGADGVYIISNLAPGTYRVLGEQKGFSPLERDGIVLFANRIVNVDLQLTIGAAGNRIEVTGEAPVINTETGTTNYAKTAEHIEDMPMLLRQTNNNNAGFGIYNPGVAYAANGGAMTANGVRMLDTYHSNDGIVEMADATGVGGGQIGPQMDGVALINYTLANSPAEFKSPVNLTTVTKSGTNQYHGLAYYEYNGRALNARDFFATSVPFRVFNDFALSVGGPIRKNKTFFFADFEHFIDHSQAVVTANAPLAAWHTGDFSGLLPGTVIKDPLTGQAFPNNQIPAGRISPVSSKAQNFFYPLPNFGAPTLRTGNWRGFQPNQSPPTVVDGRVDQNFSERDSVFARISYRHVPGTAGLNFIPPLGIAVRDRNSGTGVASWTHTFGPALLNEARFGYARNYNLHYPALVGSDIISQLGIQGVTTQGVNDIPAFSITGLTGTNQTAYGVNIDTNFQWTDNLSWNRKSHALKFGFEAIRDQLGGQTIPNTVYGSYSFTGVYSGTAYADFLLGLPQSTSLSITTPAQYQRGTMWSLYAQDQWKVSPRVTLNYGVRWEMQGPYYDKFGRIYSFDPAHSSLVVPDHGLTSIHPLFPKNIPIETATQAGYPDNTLVRFPKHNIYPRFGAAYKLTSDGRTVIRGGYGIYGNTIYGALAQSMIGGPYSGSETFTNSIINGIPAFSFPKPFLPNGTLAAVQNVSGVNPNIRTPYTQQWNITLERQIRSVGISAAYIGSLTVHLLYPRNLSQPPAGTSPYAGPLYKGLNTVTWVENGGTDSYHSLQLSAFKNLGENLTFNTGFTWARDLTDQLDRGGFIGQTIENSYDRRSERGNNTYVSLRRYFGDVVYALPIGAKQPFLNKLPRVANAIIGGWRISALANLQSGQFFTPIFDGFDPSNTNRIGGRPDRIAGVNLTPDHQSPTNWFNVAAFRVPGCPDATPTCSKPANIGRFGNAGNNILEGPPMKNVDLALMKAFRPIERLTVVFQATAANAFNHPNFANPNGNISSPATANVITATVANYLQQWGALRSVHFSLKLRF